MADSTEPAEYTLAYDGSNNPPRRELTARERDILCRGLHSILYPFGHGWHSLGSKEAREAIKKHTRFLGGSSEDLKVLYNINLVMSPRDDTQNVEEFPEIPYDLEAL